MPSPMAVPGGSTRKLTDVKAARPTVSVPETAIDEPATDLLRRAVLPSVRPGVSGRVRLEGPDEVRRRHVGGKSRTTVW